MVSVGGEVMLIEKELERLVVERLEALEALKRVEVVGSRQASSTGIVKGEHSNDVDAVVAVSTGFRSHDNFSLTPVSIPLTIAITSRVEMDATGAAHEDILSAIADLLSHWHKDGNAMSEALSFEDFYAGELRMDGGSGKQFDTNRSAWVETINITVRGTQRF